VAQTFFASIQPGLEDALLAEVRRLGGKRPKVLKGGVEFQGTRKILYLAGLTLRTPTRLWQRVDEFRARDAPELFRKTRRVEWERWFQPGRVVSIRATAKGSRFYHSDKIAETVAAALVERVGVTIEPAGGDGHQGQLLLARVEDNRCELSLDAGGGLLSRRGWRTEQGEAPLRESLASAMLELVGWDGQIPLVDPCCGSGTIAIEAAQRARRIPAGADRVFAFQQWESFDQPLFAEVLAGLRTEVLPSIPVFVEGRDTDKKALRAARTNAAQAGVDDLTWTHASLEEAASRGPTLYLTNPPYGARLNNAGILPALLALRTLDEDSSLAMLWPRDGRDAVARRDPVMKVVASFRNGGLPVDLWSSST
jgi:putative N6-adenine-specific DNA methylase